MCQLTELKNTKFVMCHDVYTGLKYSWLSPKKFNVVFVNWPNDGESFYTF